MERHMMMSQTPADKRSAGSGVNSVATDKNMRRASSFLVQFRRK
jgi:hypothetical protein